MLKINKDNNNPPQTMPDANTLPCVDVWGEAEFTISYPSRMSRIRRWGRTQIPCRRGRIGKNNWTEIIRKD